MSDVADSDSEHNVKVSPPNAVKKTRQAKANKWTDEEDSSSSSSVGSDLMSDGEFDGGSDGNATDVDHLDDNATGTASHGRSKPKKQLSRETAEDTKGDTTIRFLPTRRGGQTILFRSYCFKISRKLNEFKSYYRCQTQGCKATLVIENNLFKSTAGVHVHDPDEDVKLLKFENRRQRQERIKKAKLERAARVKTKREEKKRRDEIELQKKLANRSAVGKSGPSRADDMSVGDILAMTQQTDAFDLFDLKLTKLFERLHLCAVIQSDDFELDTLVDGWNVQRQRVRVMASKQKRRRDKRFSLLRTKLEAAVNEKDMEAAARINLETQLASVNVAGCQMLLNQLLDIQKGCTLIGNPENNENCQQGTNHQHHSIAARGQEEPTNKRSNKTETVPSTDYKALFERTLKERDMALRLHEQPAGETTHRVVYGARVPLAVEGHQPSMSQSQGHIGYGVELNTQFIGQGLTIPQTSVPLSNANQIFVSSGLQNYSSGGTSGHSGANTRHGSLEPQVLLFEGNRF